MWRFWNFTGLTPLITVEFELPKIKQDISYFKMVAFEWIIFKKFSDPLAMPKWRLGISRPEKTLRFHYLLKFSHEFLWFSKFKLQDWALNMQNILSKLLPRFMITYCYHKHECEVSRTAGQKIITLKEDYLIEFYKYLYAGGSAPAKSTNIKNISKKWESETNVSSCPANFHLYHKPHFKLAW